MQIETIQVTSAAWKTPVRINLSDYDPAIHTIFVPGGSVSEKPTVETPKVAPAAQTGQGASPAQAAAPAVVTPVPGGTDLPAIRQATDGLWYHYGPDGKPSHPNGFATAAEVEAVLRAIND